VARAAAIVAAGLVESTEDTQVYTVHSQSNPLGAYRVDISAHTCTCPDSGREGIVCKHRLAAWMYSQIPPAPVVDLTARLVELEDQRYSLFERFASLANQVRCRPDLYRTPGNRDHLASLWRSLLEVQAQIEAIEAQG
jgi:hypothetical protein